MPGEVLFIRRGEIDLAETGNDLPVHYFTVDFMTADDEFQMKTRFQTTENQRFYRAAFQEISRIWAERGNNRQMECIERLYRILNAVRREEESSERLAYRRRVLAPVIRYFNDHIADPGLTVAELAKVGQISAGSLNRLFHEVYEMPASKWILSRRMELARELLANSSNSIGDAAQKTGYGDIYSFSHAFRHVHGAAPSVWRSQPDREAADDTPKR